MKTIYPDTWPQFFTATIQEWKPLLEPVKYKDIIIGSLQFQVREKKIQLNAFVIMNNHIHIIWQALKPAIENTREEYTLQKVQKNFMKFTAQTIKFDLIENHPDILAQYKVNAGDREYNFWKRRSLGIELFTPAVFQQKLEYIHNNPVKAGLCEFPEQYHYSSAKFYYTGVDDFNMLSHYKG